MKLYQPIAGLCLAALLSACGGGGGDAATTPTTPSVLTGVFVDSPVSGIDFTTATQSGKTNAKGEFTYLAGENVTFSIGSVQLPAVLGSATVTPLDIAKTTDINNQVVSNILVLLQSLDEDGNPANSIAIPATAAAKATTAIDFNVTPTVFAVSSTVTGLVANSGSVTKTLIAEAVAKAHFQSTLDGTAGTTKVNVAPVANAGTVQSVLTGAAVTLDGSTSSDANNDTLTYAWTLTAKPTGSAAALSSATSAKPTFTADVAGSYVASLVVNDGTVNSTASDVSIAASTANAAPVANAGVVQSVVAGATVTLNGATSSDANGDALTYAWFLTSKPAGSTATLAGATAVAPTFVADVAGSYVATLVVNDGKLNSAAATITVTAAVANVAPVANAGVAQSIVAGSLVTLDGSASSDANGDSLTYAWTLTSKPAGSSASLSSATSAKPTLTADAAGTYVATLVVNDGKLNGAAATITVTAAVANVAPVANAGVAQNVVAGTLVTLDGSASSDANGDTLTYAWTLTGKPAGSTAVLASATSVKPTLTTDVAGTYVATLTVNDGKLNSAAATITVTAAVANVAPLANAGVAQNVVAGTLVTLDGSASSDANGDTLTYAWTLTSKPAGSTAALSSATSAKPTLTADVAGTYVATLTVNDGQINSVPKTVAVNGVTDLSLLFTKSVGTSSSQINNSFSYGYTFGITNISNETFAVTKFEFLRNNVVLTSTTNLSQLNGGQLAPNQTVSLTTTTSSALSGYQSVFYLTLIRTGSTFVVTQAW